jgi:hypothetical protein
MKGFIPRAAALLCGGVVLGSSGCHWYSDLVDPCYPQRYSYMARQEVYAALAPQVQNGHVLDQTVWNYHFEPGSDRLTAGGLDHLAYLARRRPHPDPTIYLQTAQDVPYDPLNPEQLVTTRTELDAKRKQAILSFLMAQTAGRPTEFNVVAHDPADTGMSAVGANTAVQQMLNTRFRGGLPVGGAGAGGGGGVGGGGGSGR